MIEIGDVLVVEFTNSEHTEGNILVVCETEELATQFAEELATRESGEQP